MIARGGRALVALSALAATITLPFEIEVCGAFTVFTGFLLFVFRDPERAPGAGIVSPADGTVKEVDPARGYVSIFLALRNVHVTRSPADGEIRDLVRTSGKHAPAFSDEVERNEKVEMVLDTAVGEVRVVHMVGMIARRIVPYVHKGQKVVKSERLGLIRFGSRVDVLLPPSRTRLLVKKGQKVMAGTTCLAEVIDVES